MNFFFWDRFTKQLLLLLHDFAQEYPDLEYEFNFIFGTSDVFQGFIQDWACATANIIYKYLTGVTSSRDYVESDFQVINLIANILLVVLQVFYITAILSFFLWSFTTFVGPVKVL